MVFRFFFFLGCCSPSLLCFFRFVCFSSDLLLLFRCFSLSSRCLRSIFLLPPKLFMFALFSPLYVCSSSVLVVVMPMLFSSSVIWLFLALVVQSPFGSAHHPLVALLALFWGVIPCTVIPLEFCCSWVVLHLTLALCFE